MLEVGGRGMTWRLRWLRWRIRIGFGFWRL